MNSDEQTATIVVFRQDHTARNFAAGILVIAGVVVFLFNSWLIGLLIAALGFALYAKPKRTASCGHCGNEVAITSRCCPCCSSSFNDWLERGGSITWFYILAGSLVTFGLIWLAFLWLMRSAN